MGGSIPPRPLRHLEVRIYLRETRLLLPRRGVLRYVSKTTDASFEKLLRIAGGDTGLYHFGFELYKSTV
jgi:hypothetical protein